MHQTGFSSAAVVPQSKFTELCSSAAVVSQSKSTELCNSAAVVPQSTWNLLRCEARRRHLIMICDVFGTGQTNTLTLCYLLGKTYKSLSSHWNQHARPNYWKKLLTWAAHTFHWRLWQGFCEVWIQMWKLLRATVRKYRPSSGKSCKIDFLHFLSINSF